MRLYLNENAASMENNIVYYENLNKIFKSLIKDVLSYGNCVRKEEEKEEFIIYYVNATSISHRRCRA